MEVVTVRAETRVMRRSGLLPRLLQMWEKNDPGCGSGWHTGPCEECGRHVHMVNLRTQRSGWLEHSDSRERKAVALMSKLGADTYGPGAESWAKGSSGAW